MSDPLARHETDARWMREALALAWRGVGSTAPNPSVGAVVVRAGQLLGGGTTRPVGGPHAEVVALSAARAAGHDPAGSTMYVTLEPCGHHGRTPPCTEAILAAGVTRVVVGVVDPFPPMRGSSLALLRERGVEVELGVCAADAAAVVRGFTKAVTRGLPEVTCKVAASLDGRIATASGESQWITGQAAREHGHRLRGSHDAILVGAGTLRADDPRLTCRVDGLPQPVPVVLDTELRADASAAIFAHPRRVVLLCALDAPERELGADVVRVPRGPGGLDARAALAALAARGLHRVLVEGGGQVHRALLDADLVDTVHLYLAPTLLPGGLPWLGGPPVESLAAALRFGAPVVQALGDDVLLSWTLDARGA